MHCPTLTELPPPPPGKSGWPWTEENKQLPATMPDGSPWPRISVITPSYNQGQFIEETIRSVLLQGYPNLEYFIIDGGSTDNSVEVIQKYAPWLTDWISEPDRGQVHAINKGLTRATGELFNWINSDDLLLPGALARVATTFGAGHAVAGSVINFAEDGTETVITNAGLAPLQMIPGNAIYHQPGLWLRREGVSECGGIDESFHYAFDWDLTIRYLSLYPLVHYTPELLARFRLHEASKTMREQDKFQEERRQILEKLLTLPQLAPLHRACDRRLRHLDWIDTLSHALADETTSPWSHIHRLLLGACADPRIRWTRRTLGFLRLLIRRAVQQRNGS